MQLRILVGSVYGGAQRVAEVVTQHLQSLGLRPLTLTHPSLEDIATTQDPLLVVTSTTGHGELPPGLAILHQSLRDTLPWQPGRRFGVIMLGDSSYPTFCGGGELMREVLLEMGCREVIDPLRIDVIETRDGDEDARHWSDLFHQALLPQG